MISVKSAESVVFFLKTVKTLKFRYNKLDSICLGTVKFGIPNYGFSSCIPSNKFDPVAFLNSVELLGIHRFDTSPRYGDSETILGSFLSKSSMLPIVNSKIDNLIPNNPATFDVMFESIKSSLYKMNINKLNICYLHQNELEIISDKYIQEGLLSIKQEKLTQYLGVSVYSFDECEYAIQSGIYDFIQIPLNVFDLSFYSKFVKNNNSPIKFCARSLLLQGILVNRATIQKRIKQYVEIENYLKRLDLLANQYNLSTFDMALAFIFSLKNIDHFILGTTSIKNLKRNIQNLETELPPDMTQELLKMALVPKEWTNPRNW